MRTTPNAFKNQSVYNLQNPVGVDIVVDALQRKFQDTFNWLEKAFPRAVLVGTTNDQNDEIEFPGVFTEESKDLANMLNQDNYNAYCFFYAEDSETLLDDEYNQFIANRLQRTLHVIFWINLERIYGANVTIERIEEIKQDIWKAIGETYYTCDTAAEVVDVFDEPDNIFNLFTFNFVNSQNMAFPTVGLRFELNACYTNDIDGYNSPINQPITGFTYTNNNQSILVADPFVPMTAGMTPSQQYLFILNPIDTLPSFLSLSSSTGLIQENGNPKVAGNYSFSVIALINSQIAASQVVTLMVT